MAPRATALERRLGYVGGYCDCEIFLNGWSLDQRFWTPDREVIENGIVMHEKADEPRELPPSAAVHRGSIQLCRNWVRRHGS